MNMTMRTARQNTRMTTSIQASTVLTSIPTRCKSWNPTLTTTDSFGPHCEMKQRKANWLAYFALR
jgi:hypothetical protein